MNEPSRKSSLQVWQDRRCDQGERLASGFETRAETIGCVNTFGPKAKGPAIASLKSMIDLSCDVCVCDLAMCGPNGGDYVAFNLYPEDSGVAGLVLITDDYEPTPALERLRKEEGAYRINGTWSELAALAERKLDELLSSFEERHSNPG